MTTIDINQIKPASEAVQAAQDAMRDANNEITHIERESPVDANKIRHWKDAKADARQQYELALIELARTTRELITRAEQATPPLA
jgi:predicted  nucleic acid-binding Zn-ribbon protein